MLVRTGLVVISNPCHLSIVLKTAQGRVKTMLYVQLITHKMQTLGNVHTPWPSISQTVNQIYTQAARDCTNLDVRVLLTNIKYELVRVKTHSPIDLVIFDRDFNKSSMEKFVERHFENVSDDCDIISLKGENPSSFPKDKVDERVFKHVVLGGTFDRLHTGHKLLLSEAALRCNHMLTIGITAEAMLENKILCEFIQSFTTRWMAVTEYLNDISPDVAVEVVPLTDSMGPTLFDGSMELLVVSAETVIGAEKINEARVSYGLTRMAIHAVPIMENPVRLPLEEPKISSTALRKRLLGTLIKPLDDNLAPTPYIIGLTGGIATGKTTIGKRLKRLGAHVINCDLVGHRIYRKNTVCHRKVVEAFGDGVVGKDGEIDRKKLGNIVFKNKDRMNELNGIVWPAIEQSVTEEIGATKSTVIVIEAAVLYLAKWENICNEVWAAILPKAVAVKRVMERNHLTEEQAIERIDAQPTSQFYVDHAHVILCTLWHSEYTRMQVDSAWELLHDRLHHMRGRTI